MAKIQEIKKKLIKTGKINLRKKKRKTWETEWEPCVLSS